MTTPYENPEATRVGQEWTDALARLSEEDHRLLTLLRLAGNAIDPRYELKGIRALVGRALVDPEFRSRALADADAALAELRGHIDLPENVRIRCVENSPDELTIVLPPPSEGLSEQSRAIRDLVFSRTSSEPTMLAAGVDDNDVMPLFLPDAGGADHDNFHFGDIARDG